MESKQRASRALPGISLLLLLLLTSLASACQPLNRTAAPLSATPALGVTPLPPAASTPMPPTASPTVSPTPRAAASPIDTAPDRCAQAEGRLERGVIETELLDKPMRYSVYLPPCYAEAPRQTFPTLYLLHGQGYDEEQWPRLGAVETAERLINAGQLPPFIMVFPYDFSYKQPTQYHFAQVFLELLLPRIDEDYRTQPGAASRAIGGLSRGGAWAIHLGLRNPETFGAVGAHSPAVFYSDMSTLRLRLRDADHETFPRIYVDVGLQDSEYQSALSYAQLLNEMNLPHEWHAYTGFHEEKYWSSHVEEYLRWYAQAWQ